MENCCIICGAVTGLHLHHVIPQAYGGKSGTTVWLCASHHTQIHNFATKILAHTLHPEAIPWATFPRKAVAQQLVAAIVEAATHFEPAGSKHTITCSVEERQKLQLLKQHLQLSSIEKVFHYCVEAVFASLQP